jgi:hypothetical protein
MNMCIDINLLIPITPLGVLPCIVVSDTFLAVLSITLTNGDFVILFCLLTRGDMCDRYLCDF